MMLFSVIAHRIKDILAAGMDLSPAAMRFIDSTFAEPLAVELAAILNAESDSERDSLIELLLSPDEAVQLELEELLNESAPFEMDSEAMVAILSCPTLSVEFRLPENRGAIHLAMTPDHIRRFLHPLHMDRSIPMPIAAAVEARLNPRDRLRLRVLLRGARFDFNPSVNDFLSRLIERLDWEDSNSWESFDFALELLAGIEPAADISRTLAEWKLLLLKGLDHAQRQREWLEAANIETLLSRGQRLTYVDEAAVHRHLVCIDRICLAAFGRIVHLDPGAPDEALAFNGPPDIANVIRRLL